MLVYLGRATTKRVVSTVLATSSGRVVASRQIRAVPFQSVSVFGLGSGAKRNFIVSTRLAKEARATTTTRAKKTATKPKAKTATKKTATKKTAAKPAKKATKAKAKAKPAAKKKTTRRARAPPTEQAKQDAERKALKRVALLTEPKRKLPEGPWQLYVFEAMKGKSATPAEVAGSMARLSEEFKKLGPNELQRMRGKTEQNKLTNAATYKAWVESHSPSQVVAANRARTALKRKHGFPKGNLKLIEDERLPKRPTNAYGLYTKARWASGDLSALGVGAAAKKASEEWKSLSAAERQPYNDLAKSEREHWAHGMAAIGVVTRSIAAPK
ncbi:hypothetical protein F4780DRAFT_207103 [Xylariomycetidae sp. FL0641]|nr:hypothetical protein F4780DRAFT_207103 [Xylariomycetidae sp. FL0641]